MSATLPVRRCMKCEAQIAYDDPASHCSRCLRTDRELLALALRYNDRLTQRQLDKDLL